MKVKKNEKFRIERNSGLYFVLGLCLVLALTFVALEWKTYYEKPPVCTVIALNNPDDEFQEIPPLVKPPEPPKPQPIVNPPDINVTDDDDTILETVIEPEDNYQPDIVTLDKVIYEEVEEDPMIPIHIVEEAPIYPGCENETDKRACFEAMILKHIKRTFRYPEIAQKMGIEGKVFVNFVIDKQGAIQDIQIIRSPDNHLGEEAARIISKLPKMTPGKQQGVAVKVPFSIPIHFVLQ